MATAAPAPSGLSGLSFEQSACIILSVCPKHIRGLAGIHRHGMTGCVVLQPSLNRGVQPATLLNWKESQHYKIYKQNLRNEDKQSPALLAANHERSDRGKEISKVTTCRQRIGNWTTLCSFSLPGASQVPMSGQATP